MKNLNLNLKNIRRYLRTHTVREAADHFGLSTRTVYWIAKRHGWSYREGKQALSREHPAVKQIELFFRDYQGEHQGVPPTVREISEYLGGTAPSLVYMYLKFLQREGVLGQVDTGSSRAYFLNAGFWYHVP